MPFDKTNTAIIFVDNGLFCAKAIKEKKENGNPPVIKASLNIDGVEKEVAFWFSTNRETGQYNLTKAGNKMLTGQIKDPRTKTEEQGQTPVAPTTSEEFDDNIPF